MLFSDLYWQQYEEQEEPKTKKAKKEKEKEESREKRRKYKQSLWSARHLKRTLRLTDSVEDIMTWDSKKKYEMLNQALSSPETFEGDSFQRLLIFISGNLDEAYDMADKTDEAEMDADIFHEFSTKINLVTIKRALRKRFKPEQIARFGNTHVIYPSLARASYVEIINRKVQEIVDKIAQQGVEVVIDQSVRDCIYRNGVFPAQGVRPVLSTVNAMLGNAVPGFFMTSVQQQSARITIRAVGEELVATINRRKYYRPIEGSIDRIKKEKNAQQVMLTSVHEAGHAVVYALLFNVTPVQIVGNSVSENKDGWCGIHPCSFSKDSIYRRIATNLAGIAAEEWLFGDENKTAGCSLDLYAATSLAGHAIRQWGMNGKISVRSNRHNGTTAETAGLALRRKRAY
jgi:cell division protease FtsH